MSAGTSYDIAIEQHETLTAPLDARLALDALPGLLADVLAGEDVAPGSALTVLLAGDELLHELNLAHRGVDAPTDVLSFATAEGEPFPGAPGEDEPPYLGDILVSVPTAERQATAAGLDPSLELRHLVIHGLLHILGYDHEEEGDRLAMEAREEAFLGPAVHAAGHDGHD